MKPTQHEFQIFLKFDTDTNQSSSILANDELKSLAIGRIKSMVEENRASIENIKHYANRRSKQTAALLEFQTVIGEKPVNYEKAYELFKDMHVNEMGAMICLMIGLTDADLSRV